MPTNRWDREALEALMGRVLSDRDYKLLYSVRNIGAHAAQVEGHAMYVGASLSEFARDPRLRTEWLAGRKRAMAGLRRHLRAIRRLASLLPRDRKGRV